MSKIIGGIYLIINNINFKIYVGSTVNFKRRKGEHWRSLRSNRHHNCYLQNSYNKYGPVFIFHILERITDINNLIYREQYWMDYYESYNDNIGYNISKVADKPMYGRTHTKEAREKISRGDKSHSQTIEFKQKMSLVTSGENNGMFGLTHSKKAKEKISKAAKLRNISGENNGMFGKIHSKEAKEKMSNAIKLRGTSGDNNPNSKILLCEHEIIRGYLKDKVYNRIKLAEIYGVHPDTISNIKNKRGIYAD